MLNIRSHIRHHLHSSPHNDRHRLQSIILASRIYTNCFFFTLNWIQSSNWFGLIFLFFLLGLIWIRAGKLTNAARGYYGAHLGKLSQLHHGVSGDVYAVDSRTLFLKNFNYDGEGPGKTFQLQHFFFSKIWKSFLENFRPVQWIWIETECELLEPKKKRRWNQWWFAEFGLQIVRNDVNFFVWPAGSWKIRDKPDFDSIIFIVDFIFIFRTSASRSSLTSSAVHFFIYFRLLFLFFICGIRCTSAICIQIDNFGGTAKKRVRKRKESRGWRHFKLNIQKPHFNAIVFLLFYFSPFRIEPAMAENAFYHLSIINFFFFLPLISNWSLICVGRIFSCIFLRGQHEENPKSRRLSIARRTR